MHSWPSSPLWAFPRQKTIPPKKNRWYGRQHLGRFRWGGKRFAASTFFCAHMDRVEPGLGIKPQIKDGIISSDGTTILAADDVAGIVAILEALRVVKEQKIPPHGRLEILFTVAEEGGLFGGQVAGSRQIAGKSRLFHGFRRSGGYNRCAGTGPKEHYCHDPRQSGPCGSGPPETASARLW